MHINSRGLSCAILIWITILKNNVARIMVSAEGCDRLIYCIQNSPESVSNIHLTNTSLSYILQFIEYCYESLCKLQPWSLYDSHDTAATNLISRVYWRIVLPYQQSQRHKLAILRQFIILIPANISLELIPSLVKLFTLSVKFKVIPWFVSFIRSTLDSVHLPVKYRKPKIIPAIWFMV